ncbi:VWA domain-containing protein [Terriglobus sp. 2YAB30_2]|uniref:VWA domain-containing protein n=2 Tax=unclassified Terriglobus TaxID=2628988 RepID=UPI003F9829BB
MRKLLPLLLATTLTAQQTGTNKPQVDGQDQVFTMKVTSNLVVETLTVKDKKGNTIPGLTAKDFTITENGAEQSIRLFEFQKLSDPSAVVPLEPAKNDEKIKIYDKLSRTQIAAESAGTPKYRDHRLLAMYFDMTSMSPPDQLRALQAAEKFIRTQMLPEDLVALLRYGGGSVDVLQDFSADRNRLLSILSTMIVGEGQGMAGDNSGDDTSDPGAAFGQDDAEFNIFNTDRQLAALQTAAEMLGRLSEKKSLLYFGSGLSLNGLNNQAQMHATTNAAIRAGVSFWPIDARGLVATPPMGDATQSSPGGLAMYTGASATSVTNMRVQSQDTLYALASDTGGKALLDNNDLTRGIRNAQEAMSSYYLLGYYTTNGEKDGKFRRIKITLNNGQEATLEYRQGYYAGKDYSKFNTADKERQLEDALMQPDPVTDLTIAMEVNYFQLNRAEYFVPIAVKIPGRELALAKKRGSQHTLIDFIGEVKDSYGSTVQNLRDSVDIKLSDSTAQELARRPIQYDAGFTLLPGKYLIKFLARDNETGRIGTYQANFTVPNLNKQVERLAISSVVLSSQRVAASQALFNVEKQKQQAKNDAVNPLMLGGEKLIPSVTRVFHHARPATIFLQAYQQGTTPPEPLLAYATFFRTHDGKQEVAMQTPTVIASNAGSTQLHTTPIAMTIPLDQLEPGEYQCQITVLGATDQKSFFWSAKVEVQ